MPVPIIIGAIIAGWVLAGGVFELIQRTMKGKHLFILGPQQSGKTTLFRELLEKEYSAKYKSTFQNITENIKELSDEAQRKFGFNITAVTDTIGTNRREINAYHKKAFEKKNNIVVYMINSYKFNRVYSQDDQQYVIDELGALGEQGKDRNKRILCILTHIDELDSFEKSHIGRREFIDRYFDPDIIQNFKNEYLPLDFIIVSLKEEYIKESLKVILKKLSEAAQ
jgi:GTPase SAR1 family protein